MRPKRTLIGVPALAAAALDIDQIEALNDVRVFEIKPEPDLGDLVAAELRQLRRRLLHRPFSESRPKTPCPVCGRPFATADSLQRHVDNKHNR